MLGTLTGGIKSRALWHVLQYDSQLRIGRRASQVPPRLSRFILLQLQRAQTPSKTRRSSTSANPESTTVHGLMAKCLSSHQGFIALARGAKRLQLSEPLTKRPIPRSARTYATHTDLPTETEEVGTVVVNVPAESRLMTVPANDKVSPFEKPVITTLYSWPSMQPEMFAQFAYKHLNVPLRKDLLHKAVIYEMDAKRQGSASTKHRTEVRGSSRKKQPQKGTGRARQSDLKSPSVRGGGVAHGPKPRDFSTDLNSKVYNLAHRTALSHRYRKGEMFITGNRMTLSEEQSPKFLLKFFDKLRWGQGHGRSLVVVDTAVGKSTSLVEALKQMGEHAEVRQASTVSVKDLLSCGRILIEDSALKRILADTSETS